MEAAADAPRPGQWLRDGRRLEVEQRWGEALTHYEESLRQFPGDGDLKQHFDIARLHYELGRRYNDRSFRDGLARMSLKDSLDLYNEVLLKLQAHYVELPKWDELVASRRPQPGGRPGRDDVSPDRRPPSGRGRSWRSSAANSTRPSPRGASARVETPARRPPPWPA